MNLRFDASSIRVRMSHEEAIQLNLEGRLEEVFPAAALRLEVRTGVTSSLNLDRVSQMNFRMMVPEGRLREILVQFGNPQLKKDQLSIRNEVQESDCRFDLVFEVDCFKRKGKKDESHAER